MTVCRPRWCWVCPVRRSPTATAPPRSCCSAPTSKRSCRYCTCAYAAPRSSSACRSSTSRRSTTVSPSTRRSSPARCPGEDLSADALEHIARARGDRPGPVVVVLGRASLADSESVSVRAARALRELPDVRFLSALRRGNVHGAIDSGLVPGLPARPGVDRGRTRVVRVGVGEPGPEREGPRRPRNPRGRRRGQGRSARDLRLRSHRRLPRRRSRPARDRRREAHDRGRRVPHRHLASRRSGAAVHALGREGRERHESRGPGAARRPQGRAGGRGDGRLADRERARAPPRQRFRLRDRRRGDRRARSGRARARGSRRRVPAPRA